ncbi:hypothetical protein [Gimesia benthica]|nr:hypothetical protein [Gimesia benthica]
MRNLLNKQTPRLVPFTPPRLPAQAEREDVLGQVILFLVILLAILLQALT